MIHACISKGGPLHVLQRMFSLVEPIIMARGGIYKRRLTVLIQGFTVTQMNVLWSPG